MHVKQVLLFILMFWVHILQESPLKYFFKDPKNLAVRSLSVGHSAHNNLSAWTDDFIFFHNLLCLPHLQNGVANSEMCICALLGFALQVKGLFSGNYKKTINKPLLKTYVLEKSSHSGLLSGLVINQLWKKFGLASLSPICS